jgi:hypothetical protein
MTSESGIAWSRSYAGTGEGDDLALAQIVTRADRIAYVGQASIETRLDALAVAYDTEGNLVFTRTLEAEGGDAWLAALAEHPTAGNLIVGGRAKSAGGDYDALVARLDATGNVVWHHDFDGVAGAGEAGDDEAQAVAVDPAGNAYAAGRTWNGKNFDVFVVKLDPAGNEQWRRAIDLGHGDDEAFAAAFDAPGAGNSAGSLWIAGRASNGQDTDALTLRLDANGNELFRALAAGTEERDDEHDDLVVGPPGHATVAGASAEVDQSYNFQAIRYVTSPIDVDYDGQASALGDGMLTLRWLFGHRGSSLTSAAIDEALCVRCPANTVDLHLAAVRKLLDVDGDGEVEALTDGLLIFRWLFGLRGTQLTIAAVDAAHCTRCHATAIEDYLDRLD